MNLPCEFISNIQNVFQEDGRAFLDALPDMIAEASARWSLTDVKPSSALSYNFVAFARRASTAWRLQRHSAQDEVVLKMGVPNREMISEMAALRLFNGEGACRLIDRDEEKCWMLLERLKPGVMLSTLEDDEEATHIAADVMQKIWRPIEHVTLSRRPEPFDSAQDKLREGAAKSLSTQDDRLSPALAPGASVGRAKNAALRVKDADKFIRLSDWFEGLKKLHPRFNGGTGPLNEKLVERVERSVKDFFDENQQPVLMHGDFHHFNILSSERGWLVIDPKGVIGPACYEVGPFLMNPWGDLLSRKDYRLMTKRRIDIFHERLGVERERIREWGLAHAILSAWWSIEDHGDWQYAANFAEIIAELK